MNVKVHSKKTIAKRGKFAMVDRKGRMEQLRPQPPPQKKKKNGEKQVQGLEGSSKRNSTTRNFSYFQSGTDNNVKLLTNINSKASNEETICEKLITIIIKIKALPLL